MGNTFEVIMSWVIAGLWVVGVLIVIAYGTIRAFLTNTEPEAKVKPIEIWGALLIFAFLWWGLAGGFSPKGMTPAIAASLFGISLGTLAGFIFTAYSDEAQSLGRVRDLLFAAVATATVAEAATGLGRVKIVLEWFGDGSRGAPQGITVASIVVFAVVGFVGSFILRELLLNVQLAKARNERKRLESVLVDILTPLKDFAREQDDQLSRIGEGGPPSAEIQSRAEQIVTLFRASKLSLEELGQADSLAIAQCYAIRRLHPAAIAQFLRHLERFGFDRAAVVGAVTSYEAISAQKEAAKLLEQHGGQLGDLVDQWLGYYLLWDTSRIEDAIRHSEAYLRKDPTDPGAMLNRVCGLAQRYALSDAPADRAVALEEMKKIVEPSDRIRRRIGELMNWNDDFFVFRKDEEFLKIIGNA